MKKFFFTLVILYAFFDAAAQQKDPLVGFYKGVVEGLYSYPFGNENVVCAEVSRWGDKYRIRLTSKPLVRADTYFIADGIPAKDGKLEFSTPKWNAAKCVVENGAVTISGKSHKGNAISAKLAKTEIKSPTLGIEPPSGAFVLFDGKNTEEWKHHDESPCSWEIRDGAMYSKKRVADGKKLDGSIVSKRKFGACRLHVEFMTPAYYPDDNTRGNSGVYLGPFEIQIIDSFGEEGNWWQCGAIYRMHAPKSNACLEPAVWQTYDIDYIPAVFDNGKLVSYPEMSVWHNGVRVQYREPVYHYTNIALKDKPITCAPVPIELQDHAHPVAFRNVWVQPK